MIEIAETGLVPDWTIRFGIRHLLRKRLELLKAGNVNTFVSMMNSSDIAPIPDIANEQHYEVPAEFFQLVLGKHQKYSCCYWGKDVETLDQAEDEALEITCERAQITDGQTILDLGCGWGSLSLYLAQRFPQTEIVAVSNSDSQREFITQRCQEMGITNIDVITADINHFSIDRQFDRVVSIEMFEHLRNYGAAFEKVSNWLRPDGRFFMHIFCHRSMPYEFVDRGPADWMSRHFFSGGIMPSEDLPLYFQTHLSLVDQWLWSGEQYQNTADAWLKNIDKNKADVLRIFDQVYGPQSSQRWWMRWRLFFLAVSELFGSNQGTEWRIGHYLFEPKNGG